MAVILEHLVEYTATAFRGDDARGPRKLLAMPDGSRSRAAVDDVRAVEDILRRLAAEARQRQHDLHRASVLVDRAAVVPADVPEAMAPSPPVDEGVVDSGTAGAEGSTLGHARRPAP
jgi:hypothetical protein